MNSYPYSCERSCPCGETHDATKLIVITGGPGAGKTAVLEFIRKIFCTHIAILPESASILFGGGFWRLSSPLARKSAQRVIYHMQNEMQLMVIGEKQWSIALCDRGTLDGMAYWPGTESDFYKDLNTSKEKEYAKYFAVVHLNSPTIKNGYNLQNPIRTESASEAFEIDRKIAAVWRDHPNYHQIASTGNFVDKIYSATSLLQSFLPECCKSHLTT